MSKISGPLLDRIDIHIEVPAVDYKKLTVKTIGESSTTIRERVIEARQLQTLRFRDKKNINNNSDMASREIREYCKVDSACSNLLSFAMDKLNLSARAYDRILKVSRTIADLDSSPQIQPPHVSEAIQYRSLDREFWKH